MTDFLRRPAPSLVCVGAVLSLIVGCGTSEQRISGRVSCDGKPVEQGVIVFEPPAGAGQTAAAQIKDGAYELKSSNVVVGQNVVRIRAFRKTGRQVSAKPAAEGMVDEVVQFLPPRYNDRSSLMADLDGKKELDVNFDLSTK
jgi:hypothetical protein